MPHRGSFFIGCIILLGATSIGFALNSAESESPNWLVFGVLLTMAIPAQLYEAQHGRQSYYPHFILFFASVLMLPLYLFALIIIIPHLIEWARELIRGTRHLLAWYVQPFNIATHLVVGTASFLFVELMHAISTHAAALPTMIIFPTAALIYVVSNHLIVGGVQLFASGISFEESRVMTVESLLPDIILACLGILIVLLWAINPWWIGLALLPLVLMYQALHVPQLKQDAETDSKTGLWNARYFTKAVTTSLAEAVRTNTPLAFIMADLDYLRTINNTHGHLAGDIVLTGIAKIIREAIRDQDIAARFGGEEFTIALPGSDLTSATALGERIRRAIEQTEFVTNSGEVLRATISMGISCFPYDGTTLVSLTHAADLAVYYAKFLGRNRVISALEVPYATKLEYLAANDGKQASSAV